MIDLTPITNNIDWANLIVGALIGGISLYFTYFKKKFESYAKVDANLQKLDKLVEIESAITSIKKTTDIVAQYDNRHLLGDIEQRISNTKNISNFLFWKRQEDSEKLERFYLLIDDATTDGVNTIEKISKELSRLSRVLFEFDDQNDSIDFDPLGDSFIRNIEVGQSFAKAVAMYDIYFASYECELFDVAFLAWYEALVVITDNIDELGISISAIPIGIPSNEVSDRIDEIHANYVEFLQQIDPTIVKCQEDISLALRELSDTIRDINV